MLLISMLLLAIANCCAHSTYAQALLYELELYHFIYPNIGGIIMFFFFSIEF